MRCIACGGEMILVNAIEDVPCPFAASSTTPTCVRSAMRQNNDLSSTNGLSNRQKPRRSPTEGDAGTEPRLATCS